MYRNSGDRIPSSQPSSGGFDPKNLFTASQPHLRMFPETNYPSSRVWPCRTIVPIFVRMTKALLFLAFTGTLLISCMKHSELGGNARLYISADTLNFDTLFTSTGSVTQQVKLVNTNNQGISINSITLMGGSASPFVINIDGTPGPSASGLFIGANDSLYIFVNVYIHPDGRPLPFVLQDSIRISYNGVDQFIQLSAWGQNAHFLTNTEIKSDTTWTNDLPYVIHGGLHIDSNATLTIQAGTHIYLHADAPVLVDGSLRLQGDSASGQRIYFSGDRLDQPYADYPGSWPGIYFNPSSRDNILTYAIFQNGYHTLVTTGLPADGNPKLTLNQCVVNNSLAEGILGLQSSILAVNCLVSNCGQNIVIGQGGVYQFDYCTVATYSTNLLSHQQPVLTVSNASTNGTQLFTADLNATFTNCIFWGSEDQSDEAQISKQGTTGFQVVFDHTILKQQHYPANIDSMALWLNTDPEFVATGFPGNQFNFHLQAGSPAVDHGINTGIPIDLDGNPRPVGLLPDLGCYERQ